MTGVIDYVMGSLVHPASGKRYGYKVVDDGSAVTFYGLPFMFRSFKKLESDGNRSLIEWAMNAQNEINERWMLGDYA